MDVILDSNAYLSDIRMESIKFKNLFDYLRRTKSSLVVLRLVREETVGKYMARLANQSKKAATAVQELNRLILDKDDQTHFYAPDVRYAVRHLRAKFRAPAKGISVVYYPETTGVDVSEVFLRGVKRRRPANSEGEELRDVIIWLIVLHYAESEKKHVAFVTADGSFWKDAEVHDHIAQDISNRKLDVHLFRTVDDFVKASAPTSAKVDAAYVSRVLDETKLVPNFVTAAKKAMESSKKIFWQSFTVRSVKLTTAKLADGSVFEINPETKFLELSYDLTFIVQALLHSSRFEQPQMFAGLAANIPSGSWGFGQSRTFPGFGTIPSGSPLAWSGGTLNPFAPPEPPQADQTTAKVYSVHAKAQISVRLVNDVLTETELDGLEIAKADEVLEATGATEIQVEQVDGAAAANGDGTGAPPTPDPPRFPKDLRKQNNSS
jgi:hypothetical protein